ncbi:MAG: WYL domain-containing protein [Acidobacteria bacterium]|nr:WYL domain-containing protein [Acidobacteriota bacterium]
MSRNDQVTRQWFLLQALEKPGGATLPELAAALPEDYACHPRTIRRDLQALEVRFPIYTERVDGQVRWKLVEGFSRVPAVQFSPTELMALIYSRDLMKPLEGTAIKESLDSALTKAESILPPSAHDYLRNLRDWFAVGLGPHKRYAEHRETLEQLARAIARSRTVEMRYYTAHRNSTTRRKVDPYRLWYAGGALYLIGYCHMRRDVRMFAVDRIRSLTITNHPCQLPLGFDLDAYVRDALVVMLGEQAEVELRFDRKTTAWARDRIWHPSQQAVVGKDGCLTLRLRVADTPELTGWILSFGPGVRVVGPESIRRKVLSAAAAILEQK